MFCSKRQSSGEMQYILHFTLFLEFYNGGILDQNVLPFLSRIK